MTTTLKVRKYRSNPQKNGAVGVPVPQPPGSSPVPTITDTTIVTLTTTRTRLNPAGGRIVWYEDENDRFTTSAGPGTDLGDVPFLGLFDPKWEDPKTGEAKDRIEARSPLTGSSRTVTTVTRVHTTVTTYDQKGEVFSSKSSVDLNVETHTELFWGGGWVPEAAFARMFLEMKRP